MARKGMSELDEMEYSSLQESVSRIQNLLFFGGLEGDALTMLHRFVENAKSRIGALEIKAAETERKEEQERATQLRNLVSISALVERETALDKEEKEEYRGFLGHAFFTKSMFHALEHFYSRSWDKLTEGGKAEMSHRVWEGVRHGEYRFDELPKVMKEKEAKEVENSLKKPEREHGELAAISGKDKVDFLESRRKGQREESYAILERPAFVQHVAKSATGSPAELAPKFPALEQGAAHAVGSTKIGLQDLSDFDGSMEGFKPPLPEKAGSAGKNVRG